MDGNDKEDTAFDAAGHFVSVAAGTEPRHDSVMRRNRPGWVRKALYVFIAFALVLICALLALYGGFGAVRGSGCQGDAFNATAAYGFNLWLNPGNWGSMGPSMVSYCKNWTATHLVPLDIPV